MFEKKLFCSCWNWKMEWVSKGINSRYKICFFRNLFVFFFCLLNINFVLSSYFEICTFRNELNFVMYSKILFMSKAFKNCVCIFINDLCVFFFKLLFNFQLAICYLSFVIVSLLFFYMCDCLCCQYSSWFALWIRNPANEKGKKNTWVFHW